MRAFKVVIVALLAPSVTIAENVLKGMVPDQSDNQFLWMTRIVVICFAVLVTIYSINTDATIQKMVENAYKVTLVAAFVPLAAGVYWRRATTQGALGASLAGLATWITMEMAAPQSILPPQFAGLLASIVAMVLGSLLPQWYGGRITNRGTQGSLRNRSF